jgi:drug/metabolite transporter (DMT)-like permease
MKNLKGFLALLTTGMLLGSFGIWIRLLNHDITPYQQIAFRNIIGFLIAIIILLVITKTKISFNDVPKKYLFAYTFLFPLVVILYTLSLLMTKIAVTTFALYIGSISASSLIGMIFFKEKMTKLKVLSLILVFIGLLFFMMPLNKITIDLGLILGVLSGVVESISNSFRKQFGNKIERFTLVVLSISGSIIISTVLILFAKQSIFFFPQVSSMSWAIGLLFGFLIVSMTYLTIVGFQSIDLNLGTIVLSSELFFAPLFAYLVFRESPTTYEMIGGFFVLVAIIIPNSNYKKLFTKQ